MVHSVENSISSPRSMMQAFGSKKVMNSAFWVGKPHSNVTLLVSGHYTALVPVQTKIHSVIRWERIWKGSYFGNTTEVAQSILKYPIPA